MVFISSRYSDAKNQNIDGILVNEVRGNFGKKKWAKAEIKGKSGIFLSSLNLSVSRCFGKVQSPNNIIQKMEKTLKFPYQKIRGNQQYF